MTFICTNAVEFMYMNLYKTNKNTLIFNLPIDGMVNVSIDKTQHIYECDYIF